MPLDRTDSAIQEQIDWCRDRQGNIVNNYPGMTYEEGVEAALQWVTGESEEKPIDIDPDEEDEDEEVEEEEEDDEDDEG